MRADIQRSLFVLIGRRRPKAAILASIGFSLEIRVLATQIHKQHMRTLSTKAILMV